MVRVSSTNRKHRFTVLVEPAEEGGYVVHVPALPGCVTQGETFEEASVNAREAIEGYIEGMKDMGQEIPWEGDGTVVLAISIDIDT